jgi:hypothetical protein
MALVLADRVLETTTVAGTGDASLAGAVTGYQPFSVVGGGNTTYYTIVAIDDNGAPTGDWEVGIGTYITSGNKISRDTVLSSSNGGALVYFASGTKQIFLDLPSEELPVASGDVTGPASAVANNFAAFNMTTGKLIKDSGYNASSFATAAQGALADTAVQPGSLGSAAYLTAGAALGVATLDAGGKVPTSQIPQMGDLNYQGTWNASTNTPTLTSSAGTKGFYYVVSVAGSTNLNGITDWKVGDWAVFNGSVWEKIDNTDAVTSVNGLTGTVVLTTTDIAEGTNEYFTTAKARASVSAGTGISYDSGTGVITNSAPDQTVALTDGTAIDVTGTYPNFTINNTAPDQVVALTAGTGISTSGTYPNFTITNTSPSLGGDVVGPASATDNAVARYNLTTGKLIQNSGVIIDDSNNVTSVNTLTATNIIVNDDTTLGGSNADSLAVNARITTDLEPATNNAKDIGTNGRNWRDGFFGRNLGTVNLSVTGTTSFDGSQGTSGQVLTSAGTGNTPTWTTPTTGTVTSVTGTAPIASTGGATPAISISQATTSTDGYLSSTDWNTFNGKGSGTVTSVGGTGTVNGITLTGTVTSTGNLTLGGTLGGIGNSQLTNSAVTIGITSVSLGATATTLAGLTSITSTTVVASGVVGSSATGALTMPSGTTAERPGTPATGMVRYNTTLGVVEYYNGTTWYTITAVGPPTTVEYLVVAGGGAGGSINMGYSAGSGGAGGYRTNTGYAVSVGSAITVTVGAGGTAAAVDTAGGNGSDSVFGSITSTGGGGGGIYSPTVQSKNGGSGGGSLGDGYNSPGLGNTPSTSPSQGNNGGNGNVAGPGYGSGGGGGSGSVGGSGTSTASGAGGSGTVSSISGTATTYSAGAGGSSTTNGSTPGASGGTGAGAGVNRNLAGISGTANTGGGGSACGGVFPRGGVSVLGGAGGSGVVIIRYADTYAAAASTTGSPTITVAGGYRVYRWTGSGSITF